MGQPLLFEALAGAGSLDENAYLLRVGASVFLLDAGSVGDVSRAPGWLARLEAAPTWTWISHVHADHAGGLPALSRRFVRLPWLTTAQTHRLLPHALARGAALPEPTRLAFGERMELIETAELTVGARAMVAGHMLGAASLLLDIQAGERFLRFFYLSDFSLHAQHGVPAAGLPDPAVDPVDVMVMEGVLSAQRAEQRCADELSRLRADLDHAGPRLIAASALCQAPQVLLGALAGADEVVYVHEVMAPALEAWEAASSAALPARRVVSLADAAALLAAGRLVVASGEHMEARSPAGLLARGLVGRADARIYVLNSLRARELGLLAGRRVRDEELEAGRVAIGAARLTRYEAPLHATAPDLVRAVAHVRPKRLLLVHGRAAELYRLAKQIRREVAGIKVEVVEAGRAWEL